MKKLYTTPPPTAGKRLNWFSTKRATGGSIGGACHMDDQGVGIG